MLTYKFLSIFPQVLFLSFERIFIEFYFSPFHNSCFCADTSCLNVQLCAHFYPLCFSAPQTFSQVCTPSPLFYCIRFSFFPLRFLECTIMHEKYLLWLYCRSPGSICNKEFYWKINDYWAPPSLSNHSSQMNPPPP